MKDEAAREVMRKMAADELPVPSWSRVDLRARFEEQFAARRKPFRALPWVQLAVYAGIGLALGGLVAWAILEFFG